MTVIPQDEHRWLTQLVGDWTYEMEAAMPADASTVRETGTEAVRTLGGIWLLCEARSEGADAPGSIMTLGFDPTRARFVGTFAVSMLTHLWVYEGTRDGAGTALTLETVGPGLRDDGTTARYRDVITLQGPDARTLTSNVEQPDGSWERFMTMHYRRAR
jgi:hypothetical protein